MPPFRKMVGLFSAIASEHTSPVAVSTVTATAPLAGPPANCGSACVCSRRATSGVSAAAAVAPEPAMSRLFPFASVGTVTATPSPSIATIAALTSRRCISTSCHESVGSGYCHALGRRRPVTITGAIRSQNGFAPWCQARRPRPFTCSSSSAPSTSAALP